MFRMGTNQSKTNDYMIDQLVRRGTLNLPEVEEAFRLVDRAKFIPDSHKNDAYRDIPLKILDGGGMFVPGPLHMSAPDIYAKVVCELDLLPGQKFLNIGSGTGYLSSVIGFLLGDKGVNHGVEHYENLVKYAELKVEQFVQSPSPNFASWCRPKFFSCNALCDAFLIDSPQEVYDRIYCGAAFKNVKQLNKLLKKLKVGGKLIVPMERDLTRYTRISASRCTRVRIQRSVFSDSIQVPEGYVPSQIPSVHNVMSLRELSRSVMREYLRNHVFETSTRPTVRRYLHDHCDHEPSRIWLEEDTYFHNIRDAEQLNWRRLMNFPDFDENRPAPPLTTQQIAARKLRIDEDEQRVKRERELRAYENSVVNLESLNKEIDTYPIAPVLPDLRREMRHNRDVRGVDPPIEELQIRLMEEMNQMLENGVLRDHNNRNMAPIEQARHAARVALAAENARPERIPEAAILNLDRIWLDQRDAQRDGFPRVGRNGGGFFNRRRPRENRNFVRNQASMEDMEDGEELLEIVEDLRPRGATHNRALLIDDTMSSDDDDDDENNMHRNFLFRQIRRLGPTLDANNSISSTVASVASVASPSSQQDLPSTPSPSSMTTEPQDDDATASTLTDFRVARNNGFELYDHQEGPSTSHQGTSASARPNFDARAPASARLSVGPGSSSSTSRMEDFLTIPRVPSFRPFPLHSMNDVLDYALPYFHSPAMEMHGAFPAREVLDNRQDGGESPSSTESTLGIGGVEDLLDQDLFGSDGSDSPAMDYTEGPSTPSAVPSSSNSSSSSDEPTSPPKNDNKQNIVRCESPTIRQLRPLDGTNEPLTSRELTVQQHRDRQSDESRTVRTENPPSAPDSRNRERLLRITEAQHRRDCRIIEHTARMAAASAALFGNTLPTRYRNTENGFSIPAHRTHSTNFLVPEMPFRRQIETSDISSRRHHQDPNHPHRRHYQNMEHYTRNNAPLGRRRKRRSNNPATVQPEDEEAKRRRLQIEAQTGFFLAYCENIYSLPLPKNLQNYIMRISHICN